MNVVSVALDVFYFSLSDNILSTDNYVPFLEVSTKEQIVVSFLHCLPFNLSTETIVCKTSNKLCFPEFTT